MKTDPRILILWAKPNATNLGIQALYHGAHQFMTSVFEDAQIGFHDHDTPGSPLGKRPLLRYVLNRRSSSGSAGILSGWDLICDSGSGDSFTDIYGKRRFSVMAMNHRAARSAGVPLILLPQTVGPFDSRYAKVMAKRSLTSAALVMARDSETVAFCKDRVGIDALHATDMVFGLSQPPPGDREGGVALNVSGLLWRPNPHVDHELYRSSIRAVVDEMRSIGKEVILFPHVLRSLSSVEDDVTAVEEASRANSGTETFFPTDLWDVRDFLSRRDIVVGARMHACLNAISTGVPALAWAYSKKFAPLLGDIGWNEVTDLRTASDGRDVAGKAVTAMERLVGTGAADEAGNIARRRLDASVTKVRDLVQ